MLPSYQDIEKLHRKLAPDDSAFEFIFGHCKIVWEIAQELLHHKKQPAINRDLVEAGCLLHDIGVYALYDSRGRIDEVRYIQHGPLGEALLAEHGFSATLGGFAAHHTGVGLTREDILQGKLPLKLQDYLPRTPEERLVLYADKFHAKGNPPYFFSFDGYRSYVCRFGLDKQAKFDKLAAEFGQPDISTLVALAVKYSTKVQDC
jgi:uncharacterized protein